MRRLPPSRPDCRACVGDIIRRHITTPADGRPSLLLIKRAAGLGLGAAALAGVLLTQLPSPAQQSAGALPHATATSTSTTSTTAPPETALTVPGYQLLTATGVELPFGATSSATPPPVLPHRTVAVARTPSGEGSWRVAADGGVITSGDAGFYGSLGNVRLASPVVSIAGTPSGNGYWLASADGGVFAFGDAAYLGGASGSPLASGVVGMAATPSGNGYWLVAADGGVFAYGDAEYLGGMAGTRLSAPIVSIAPTDDGRGYWLAARDAGVFAFGGAEFFGRPAPGQLRAGVVGIAGSESGKGYWLASADGGVFTYGDAPFLGSIGGRAHVPVVAIAAGTGNPLTAKATEPVPAASLRARFGYDISWPQCDGPYPTGNAGYSIIGVTGGRPFTRNRCLADEWQWVRQSGAAGGLYINLATPVVGDPRAMDGAAGPCTVAELACQVWNFSAKNIDTAVAYAGSSGASAPMWWLDVEGANRWSPYANLNAYAVRAAVAALAKHGIASGVYSTPRYWREITGSAQLLLPVWVASTTNQLGAPSWCTPAKAFTGGAVWLVQALPGQFDTNFACDGLAADPARAFTF